MSGVRVGKRLGERVAGRRVADQAERKGCHLLDLGIRIAAEQRLQSGDPLGQLHATGGERRAPPQPRIGVLQEEQQIAGGRSQLAFILELQDRGELLLVGRGRRLGDDLRNDLGSAAVERARRRQRQDQ